MIKIDGSYGEGGGQILRSALALSIITNKPIEVFNIRAKRSNPGLRPQHLATIKLLAELTDAEVDGLAIGKDSIRFIPKGIKKDKLSFDVGTAGSITLILQAIIPAVSLSDGYLEVELIGGTDVKWSPTIDYVLYVLRHAYRVIGIDFDLEIQRRGYYPYGGGKVRCIIKPAKLRPLTIVNTPRVEPNIVSVCSNLPNHVAERQIASALSLLEKHGIKCNKYTSSISPSQSKGSSILVYATGDYGPFIGGDAIGERGKSAESVGKEAAEKFLKPYLSNASVDVHLADMLVLPLSLANGKSSFVVNEVSMHLDTNLYIVKSLTNCNYSIEKHNSNYMITIDPSGV